ncbi:monooxygenase [Nonomuraea sp. NPDC048826]|uniref:monooxygenase n=1 Tax=Nonomuraea sp. NPDC048826 TaxID=3364347 RepID=UPI00371C3D41
MKRLIRTASALAATVLLAACGATATGPPPGVGHSGHGAHTPEASPLRDGERFVTLTMPEAYSPAPPNGGTDDYRCFLIDPGLEKQVFLTGAQFQPQNTDLVHHAIFYRVGPEQVAEAERLDESAPGEGYTCFGDGGVDEASWVAHWAPGTEEVLLDPSHGYAMPPGSRLVMQVHYNTLDVEGKPGTDRSGIRLRVTDRELQPFDTVLFAAPIELPCTPEESGPLCDRAAAVKDLGRRFGESSLGQVEALTRQCGPSKPGPTQHCDLPVEWPAEIHAMAGHMHLLGRAIKVELNPGTPEARTLLDVPAYNFDDQALQPLPEPVAVERGDVVRVTCTHDAGLRAKVPQLQKLDPRYVVWGDGTADEMCLGIAIASAT